MKNVEQSATIALDIDKVSKEFYQLQRGNGLVNLVKNMWHSEKKKIQALDNISFQVKQGEFVAYAGANGAGKSTTLKILAGMLRPTAGKITVLGKRPKEDRVKLMQEVGVLYGQRSELWWDHPVISSFKWKKAIWNIPDETYTKTFTKVCELLELEPILNTFARELSLGQTLRANIGMLLLHEPKLILLDEPTLGLDIRMKQKVVNILKELNKEQGTTIVVTSHDMGELEMMAKRIILLSSGKIVFDGSFEALREKRNSFLAFKLYTKNTPPNILGFKLEDTDGYCHSYTALNKNINTQQLLMQLAAFTGIDNIEIGKIPIEEVITQIYEENLKANVK